MNVDAIEQGTADSAKVMLNLARSAATLTGGIAEEPAFTPVQITTATDYETGVPGGRDRPQPDIAAPFAQGARTLRRQTPAWT